LSRPRRSFRWPVSIQDFLDHCAPDMSPPNPAPRAAGRTCLDPLLDLNMRLGEASGAGVAILLLRAALACHAEWPPSPKQASPARIMIKPCRAT